MTQTTFANNINPFDRLGKLTDQPKPAMEKPAKTKRIDERYSQAAAPAPAAPVAPESKKAVAYITPDELSITDDALPARRALPKHKYHAVFAGMKMGQSVRCPTSSVGKVSGAMRKYVELKGLKAHVKSVIRFDDDTGYGRVWLLETPTKPLKVAA